MAQDNKVVSLKGQKLPDRFSLPGSLVRLRDVSGQSLKSVLSGFFDKADDALFELAECVTSGSAFVSAGCVLGVDWVSKLS